MKTRAGHSTSLIELDHLSLFLHWMDVVFIYRVKYLGVIFDKKITWRAHIEMIEAKTFRTFIRVYSLFSIERFIVNSKLTLHKDFIISVMTYACPTCEFVADTHLMKLQHLQDKVLCTIGTFQTHTPVREMHMFFTFRTHVIIWQNYEGNKHESF
jgi:hypothetical protein